MDNPARTAEHHRRCAERQEALRAAFAVLLDNAPPFVLEIGCGHGHFLTGYAAAHPAELCLGIDLRLERIERAERKRRRSGLANLHFLRAAASDFLAALPARARFSALYILFPDPWPKQRHHKNRLMNPIFLQEVAGRAGPGVRLYFRTDYEPYFAETAAALGAHPAWRLLPAAPWPFELPTVFQARAAGYHSLVAERV